jgi:peptidoglycan/xylan/chitin deacetylase (PgdA/CDA1 family)
MPQSGSDPGKLGNQRKLRHRLIADPAASASLSGSGWSLAPAIWCSVMLHIGGVVTVAAAPKTWPWVVGALVSNHLGLGAIGMWPKSRLLGPNLVRLPEASARRREVALTFDDGPSPLVTLHVLDLLDRYRAKASFFCIGERAATHPDIVREIVRRGHTVENHSFRHSSAFACYGPTAQRREIEAAQRIICSITGRPPQFFRAPFGLRNPLLASVLARTGLHYVSWTRRGLDTVSGDAQRVLRRLTRRLAAGDVLLLHDGSSAVTRTGQPLVLTVLPFLLEQIAARGLKSVTLPSAMDA